MDAVDVGIFLARRVVDVVLRHAVVEFPGFLIAVVAEAVP